MTQRILAAIDGSDLSWRALDVAVELAAALGAELVIFHAHLHGRPVEELFRMAEVEHLVPSVAGSALPHMGRVPGTMEELLKATRSQSERHDVITQMADLMMAQAVEKAKAGGVDAPRTRFGSGDHADAILEAAEADDADMIVMGTRGLGLLSGVLLGSVSQKVLHHAPCTVVTAR